MSSPIRPARPRDVARIHKLIVDLAGYERSDAPPRLEAQRAVPTGR